MNEKLKTFLKEILILLCLVVGINLFAFVAIKFRFLNSEYSMAGCTFIGVGAYLVYFFTKLKGKK
ncbi:hypothetical protein [Fusobacterium animalis]|uniref:hypothetical protein n=1 Tax=Fusobacterium animalis TaxID=76859 RepID=UPI0034DDFA91